MVGSKAREIVEKVEIWVNGDEVALASLKGRPALLFFWHPRDSGKSLAALPHIQELASSFAPNGLVTIGLCVVDGEDEVKPILRKYGVTFRVGLDCDADAHLSYRIDKAGTPYCYLVDGRRLIAWEGPPEELTASVIKDLLP